MGAFRSALRLAVDVAVAAAGARAAEAARRFLEQMALQATAEQRSLPSPQVMSPAEGTVVDTSPPTRNPAPPYHPFGPTPSIVPSRGIGFRTTEPAPRAAASSNAARLHRVPDHVPEPTPIDRLRALRNAGGPRPAAIDEPPAAVRPAGRHRRDVEVDSSSEAADTEFSMTVPMTRSPVTLRLAVGPQNTLTVTVSLPGATEAEPP